MSNGCAFKITGNGAVEAFKNQMASFRVETTSENTIPEIKVLGPNNQEADYTVDKENKTSYNVSYLPIDVGDYTILITVDGKQVSEPLKVSVLDGNQVRRFLETRTSLTIS